MMTMSFSASVKKEVFAALDGDRHCRVAALSAIIAGAARVTDKPEIIIKTDNIYLLKKFYDIIKNDFNTKAKVHRKKNGKPHALSVETAAEAERLLSAAGLWANSGYNRCVNGLIARGGCCRRAYLAATLLACGYVSDPVGTYHAEFRAGNAKYAEELAALFGKVKLTPHVLSRKGRHGTVLYFKDGEQIAEILRITGAHMALMRFEDERIRKSLGNNINRNANFDAANVDKSISAAVGQIESINLIQRRLGLNSLPRGLEELARKRLEYPEISLKEIGEMLSPPVSKSGVNHRLRKLKEIAKKLESEA